MQKTVLILGSSSFAGASMVNFLLDKKKYKLYGTYRRSKIDLYLPYKKNRNVKKFKKIKIDFEEHPKKLIKLIKKIKPNYIIDFGSLCMVEESWNFPEVYIQTNVLYKSTIFKYLGNCKFLNKYIYISTPEIFGPRNNSIKENEVKFNPSTPYAVSKLSSEFLLKNYNKSFGVPMVIARFSNFFGPGQPIYRLIPKVITCIDKGIKFPLHGSGNSKRSFIFSYDFCNGIYKVIKKGKIANIYHFSDKKLFKVTEVIKKISNLKSVNYRNLVLQCKERKGKDNCYKLDCRKTSRELGWRTKYSFEQALKLVVEYYKNNQINIKKRDFSYQDTSFKKSKSSLI